MEKVEQDATARARFSRDAVLLPFSDVVLGSNWALHRQLAHARDKIICVCRATGCRVAGVAVHAEAVAPIRADNVIDLEYERSGGFWH